MYDNFKRSISNISTEEYYQYTLIQVINIIVLQFPAHPAVSYISAQRILLSCIFSL
jgi:hypothetical protein